jgi:hypothetical protein
MCKKDFFEVMKVIGLKKEEFACIEPVDEHTNKFSYIKLGSKGCTGNIVEIKTTYSLEVLLEFVDSLPSMYEDVMCQEESKYSEYFVIHENKLIELITSMNSLINTNDRDLIFNFAKEKGFKRLDIMNSCELMTECKNNNTFGKCKRSSSDLIVHSTLVYDMEGNWKPTLHCENFDPIFQSDEEKG